MAFRWDWVAIACYKRIARNLGGGGGGSIPDGYRVAASAPFIPIQFPTIVKRDDRFEYWRTTAFTPPVKEKAIVDHRHHPAVPRALKDPDAKAIARFAPFDGVAVTEETDLSGDDLRSAFPPHPPRPSP